MRGGGADVCCAEYDGECVQELRAYFAGLVGMLREKAPLVEQELAHAIWGTSEAAATTSPPAGAGAGAGAGTADEGGDSAMASRAAAVKRLRAEEQEDALYRLKQVVGILDVIVMVS